jgi:hypothetical protein
MFSHATARVWIIKLIASDLRILERFKGAGRAFEPLQIDNIASEFQFGN